MRFFKVQVNVRRCVEDRDNDVSSENGESSHTVRSFKPLVRKSKLVVVDLAGSERIHKSGANLNFQLCFVRQLCLHVIFVFFLSFFSLFYSMFFLYFLVHRNVKMIRIFVHKIFTFDSLVLFFEILMN